jgi:hypothetical protein
MIENFARIGDRRRLPFDCFAQKTSGAIFRLLPIKIKSLNSFIF